MTAAGEILFSAEAEYIIAGSGLIMVHPSDASALEDACAEARNFGVQVMCWDYPMTNTNADWLIDNANLGYAIGALAGEFINQYYSTYNKAQVAVIGYPRAVILRDRENGIKQGLEDTAAGKYEIVATLSAIEYEDVREQIKAALRAQPDCKIVVGIGAGAMLGADEALKNATGGRISTSHSYHGRKRLEDYARHEAGTKAQKILLPKLSGGGLCSLILRG